MFEEKPSSLAGFLARVWSLQVIIIIKDVFTRAPFNYLYWIFSYISSGCYVAQFEMQPKKGLSGIINDKD